MAKYSKKNNVSEKTKDDALKIARGTQKPGQTKEQTKLIAQGIQKGIEQYKKKHKEKTRELDKKLNKAKSNVVPSDSSNDNVVNAETATKNKLPWILLILSWLGFIAYLMLKSYGSGVS